VLGERFDEVYDEWDTLYHHLRNAKNKADDVDTVHDRLRAAFDRIVQQVPRSPGRTVGPTGTDGRRRHPTGSTH